MSINFKGEKKPKELLPAGAYIATLYSVVQFGTMNGEYKGKPTRKNKIRLSWELPEELREFDGEMKPMVVGKTYTASVFEQAKLRPIAEGILGEIDEDTFSIEGMVGKACMVQLAPAEYLGNEYMDVVSATQLPKSVPVPKQINPSIYLDYQESWSDEVYAGLPQWMKDRMADSEEMQKRNSFAENKGSYPENELGDSPF